VQCVHCEYLKLREVGQYGRLNNGRGDGVIIDYQGEIANGAPLGPTDRKNVCIGGTLHLRPAEGVADMVIHPGPCGQGFASYDEHPGYDYYAAMNTPVMAAAGGVVVNNGGTLCVPTNIPSCAAFNFVGIDHGNGYVSQYGHLRTISVTPGQTVVQGQQIGLTVILASRVILTCTSR
jgi:murein DD-endopeptidase MepM/ murein hydrolase activator NlpD